MTHFRFFMVSFALISFSAFAGIKYPDLFNNPGKFIEKNVKKF